MGRTGRVNPPADWTWSPVPTHEPLITRDLYDAAAPISATRRGCRTGTGPNIHRQTVHSYQLRSYVVHDSCGRRMFGKTRKDYRYYACQPDPRRHADRPWYPNHPKSIWVREDALLSAVHGFSADRTTTTDAAGRGAELAGHIEQLRRRQARLIDELEHDDTDLDPRTNAAFRASVRDRFADLGRQITRAEADRNAQHTQTTHPAGDPDLIDQLPALTLHLHQAPADLQRGLYDAFDLTITYNRERHTATLRVTITADTVDSLTHAIHTIADHDPAQTRTETATGSGPAQPRSVSLVLGGPGRSPKARETPGPPTRGVLIVESTVDLPAPGEGWCGPRPPIPGRSIT